MTIAIRQFAANVGYINSKVRSAADPYHAAYIKATPEQQSALRREWMLGHLEGQGLSNPERILSQGKGKGASKANVQAIDRASSDFRYMVVRPTKGKAKAEPTRQRVSRDLRALAEAYLAHFDSAADAIKVLRAVAK